ncbi:ADP-dependent ribose-1-phosphate kinase [Glycine soja]
MFNCVCLVDDLGNRTMRPCLSNAVKIQAEELTKEDFKGSKGLYSLVSRTELIVHVYSTKTDHRTRWLVLRYAILNLEVIKAAILLAKQEGLLVSLDLASFEMVRNFKQPLLKILESGNIDLCFANEDEATELLRGEQNADPVTAVEFLAKYCQWAVVTLGPNGCIAKYGNEIARVPAIGEAKATDATGAGDLFASGFLYGVIKGLSLEECCKVGACSYEAPTLDTIRTRTRGYRTLIRTRVGYRTQQGTRVFVLHRHVIVGLLFALWRRSHFEELPLDVQTNANKGSSHA